ncbi:non-ribosomal peptide synthetase [Tyzzerella nexilis]|nr:non-ribosomal peptide synthetase [[Clostridium] nexile]
MTMINTDIISRFQYVVERYADEKALTYKNESYTYRELNRITDAVAKIIGKYTKPGMVVGIFMDKSAEYVISILAILKAGCTYLPLDSLYPVSRIQTMLEDSGCKVVVSKQERNDIEAKIIHVDESKSVYVETWENKAEQEMQYKDAYGEAATHKYPHVHYPYIIYTSGSTGSPKGIRIEGEAVLNLAEQMSIQLQCSYGRKRIAIISPFVFDVSVGQMYMALLYGNELVIVPDEVKYSLVLLTELLSKNKIYCCDFTPTRLELQVSYYEKHRMQHFYPDIIVSVGEPISVGLVKRVTEAKGSSTRIFNYYGPSEICVYCAYHEINADDLQDESRNIPIGKALDKFQLYVLNDAMCLCDDNEIGELYIAGIGVSKEGYINNPQLNENSFITNPNNPYQRLYKSGDLARRRADGNIECCGRRDDQVKIRGFRIELSEIEHVMEGIPTILRAKVLLVHDIDTDCIAAYYTAQEDTPIADIDNSLRKQLPYYMIPTYYIRVDAFSYNVNGKLDKRLLPDFRCGLRCAAQSGSTLAIDQNIGMKFLEYCAKVLNLTEVKYDDQFVSLGGDSLTAFELNVLLEAEWNISLNVHELVGQYSLGYLAEMLTARIKRNNDRGPLKNAGIVKCHANSYQKILLKEELKNRVRENTSTHNLPLYNMVYILELKKNVRLEQLQKAFNMVLQRHEMLRTHFVEMKNSYEIYWDEYKEYIVRNEYVNNISSIDVSSYVKEFDVLAPELYQMILLEDANGNQSILLNIHHLIVDYISIRIIVNEVFSLYYNQTTALPQYNERDFFTNRSIEHEKSSVDFWKGQLKGRPFSVEFSDDLECVQELDGSDSVSFQINNKDEIKDFCGKWGLTEYYLFLGALGLLLYCEEKRKDFIVGTYSMGRDSKGVPQHLIGFFTDTIPFCFHLQETLSVGMFLKMQKDKGVNILQYGGIDVGNIVRYMDFEDLSKGSLFDVSFNYMKEYRVEMKEQQQEIVLHDYSKNPQLIPFSLTGISKKDAIHFEIIYNRKKYSHKKIQLLIEKYNYIISSIIRNGDCVISNLEEAYENKYIKE